MWRPVCVASFLFLLAGLFRIQIFQGAYFRDLADNNRIAKIPIHAPRGIIYDRNGESLVSNLPSYRLKRCTLDHKCNVSLLSKPQAIEIQSKGLTEGQSLELDSTRNYPHGLATAHLLGYVSEVSSKDIETKNGYFPGDVIGRGGLEQEYEQILKGRDGEEIAEVDALGKKVRVLATVNPVPGKDVNTSIDIRLQKLAFEQIKQIRGAVMVSDPATGQIIVLASSPSFDPNVFTDLSLPDDYRRVKIEEILTDRMQSLFNRAISGTYPPGSTFKIVTATAGLESGKISQNTTIDDPGILIIGPYKFPNWKYLKDGGTQGILNVVSALKVSNDVFFYRTGEWTGFANLETWAKKFGLGNTLSVDLPGEATGNFPKEVPYLGDLYHLAIGQGDLLVTPLQVNNWTSVIASGGKQCIPHVINQLPSNPVTQCKDLGISKKTLDLVKQGLVAACKPGGTAWPLFGMDVACKTGTAEYGDLNNRTHAWLTAFAPVDHLPAGRQVAVTVLVEAGGEGSDVAAPIVKKILEKWFEN